MNLSIDDYMIHAVNNNDEEEINKYLQAKDDNSWESKYNYRLYGIVSHSGNMGGGHYISFVSFDYRKSRYWLYISDSFVD